MVDPIAINADTGSPAYSAGEFRQGLALGVLYDGRPAGGRQGVRPGGTQLQVSLSGSDILIAPGVCYIDPAWNSEQAGYWVAFPVQLTRGPLVAADVSDPRLDRVWARVWDHDEDSSGLRTADVEYQAGVADPSPTAPAVPQGALALGRISVPALGQGSPVVIDERVYTAAPGGVLLVADAAERDALVDPYPGQQVHRLDIGRPEFWNGVKWLPPGEYRVVTTVLASDSPGFTSEEQIASVTMPQAHVEPGRIYRVTFDAGLDLTATGVLRVTMYEDSTAGTRLTLREAEVAVTANVRPMRMEAEFTAVSPASKTFVVSGTVNSGGGTGSINAAGDFPSYMYVDYVRG